MKMGMLWFDDAPHKSLAQKVREAAAYYRRKYGEPRVCFVPPQALTAETLQVEGVRVLPLPTVPPHHLWIGVFEGEIMASQGAPRPAQRAAQKSSHRQVEGQKAR